jgi:hypothetical protein
LFHCKECLTVAFRPMHITLSVHLLHGRVSLHFVFFALHGAQAVSALDRVASRRARMRILVSVIASAGGLGFCRGADMLLCAKFWVHARLSDTEKKSFSIRRKKSWFLVRLTEQGSLWQRLTEHLVPQSGRYKADLGDDQVGTRDSPRTSGLSGSVFRYVMISLVSKSLGLGAPVPAHVGSDSDLHAVINDRDRWRFPILAHTFWGSWESWDWHRRVSTPSPE